MEEEEQKLEKLEMLNDSDGQILQSKTWKSAHRLNVS